MERMAMEHISEHGVRRLDMNLSRFFRTVMEEQDVLSRKWFFRNFGQLRLCWFPSQVTLIDKEPVHLLDGIEKNLATSFAPVEEAMGLPRIKF